MSTQPAHSLEVLAARLEGAYEKIDQRLANLETQLAEVRRGIRGLRGDKAGQTARTPEQLRSTLQTALGELAHDARDYLMLLDKLGRTSPEDGEAYEEAETEVDLVVANLTMRAIRLHELFEQLTNALPNEKSV